MRHARCPRHLLLDITLIYHASRTGRLQPWALFIILMIPLVGALAYIVVELVPEWFGSPAPNRRASASPASSIRKSLRELSDRLAGSDTIANRQALRPNV